MLNTAEKEYWQSAQHIAQVKDDGSDEIVFKWHFERGVLARRMSALELAAFLLPHMPHIIPLLSCHPQVQLEFSLLLERLVTFPTVVLDEMVPWLKSVTRTEFDDIVELNLRGKSTLSGPVYFLLNE